MLKRFIIFCAALLALSAAARAGSLWELKRAQGIGTHYSLTGQFVVHDAAATDYALTGLENSTNLVRLDPTLLTVSCERIKTGLLRQLGARDQWRDKIILILHHARDPDEPAVAAPIVFGHDWVYRIELPDVMDRSRFVSAMVEVLLLEMANRNSGHSAEIPAWLTQGLAREVMWNSQIDLVVEPPQKMENGVTLARVSRSGRWVSPLTLAHQDLQTAPPLTLEALSWPAEGVLDGEEAESYRSSAQLFVHDLLQLPDGRACLLAMLSELPEHLNWQLSFLHAFHSDFSSQLELEKWWELRLVQFTGRDLAQTWPAAESWQKLDEILHPSVQVRAGMSELPVRTQVTFQTIIRDWSILRQTPVLQEKEQQLFVFRLRVSQDLISLVDDYRRTLDGYLSKRNNTAANDFIGRTIYAPPLDPIARDTLRELDELDALRERLRHAPAAPAAPANPSLTANQ